MLQKYYLNVFPGHFFESVCQILQAFEMPMWQEKLICTYQIQVFGCFSYCPIVLENEIVLIVESLFSCISICGLFCGPPLLLKCIYLSSSPR